MPTILRLYGYRIGFYSAEPNEPSHVHVVKAGNEAKFWLDPVRLQSSGGFSRVEINQIERLVTVHQGRLLEAWNEYFGN